ncbi:glutaredoxin 3 [Amaricoccus sp.]|uniref:glutaredoxin 3 n=1 Tax=Amaricoccus sp. TaxID=1872485 RepID=UPI0026313F02|nr:glutaredoxin 3 [Amaricoccus sp.]HRO12664.1 glutaredoxin 3 [Amaricoccus sp.]
MKPVLLYGTPFCGYCAAARRLLAEKGVVFEEVDLAAEPGRRAEMVERAKGARSVPQLFVGGEHVGGFSEMWELDRSGKLDALLAGG